MSVKHLTQVDVSKGELVSPTPPKIDLRDAHAIRREMANVYRDMRCGNIETQDGTKLAYVLEQLRKAYETAVLEDQINHIQSKIRNRK
jgi:hypothetical protein